jgi:hypothetical protein
MSNYYQNIDNNQDKNKNDTLKSDVSSLYFISHLILSFFAIYLSWKCAGTKFNPIHFIAALCCPHGYIIWALATQGGCGVFDYESLIKLKPT